MTRSHVRQPVALPDYPALPVATRATLARADATAERIAAICADRPHYLDAVLPRSDAPLPHIHHALTPLFPRVSTAIPLAAARVEQRVLAMRAAEIRESASGGAPGRLLAVVSAIASDLNGSSELRRRDRCASPDRHGHYVVYPDPAGIAERLNGIARWLAAAGERRAVFRAMGVLVAITNCHPLEDGNGRLSRIVANALLWPGDRNAPYVPWREIALFSRGGFIVRVREAEIRGDWQPLASFMLAALEWWAALIAD